MTPEQVDWHQLTKAAIYTKSDGVEFLLEFRGEPEADVAWANKYAVVKVKRHEVKIAWDFEFRTRLRSFDSYLQTIINCPDHVFYGPSHILDRP